MRESRLTADEKAEIIRLRGKRTSTDIAIMFQTGESTVRMIWKSARDDGDEGADLIPLGLNFSSLTGMRVRAPQAPNEAMMALAADEPLVTTGKTLADLTPCDCRWIIGKDDQDDIRYCAEVQCGRRLGPTMMYCHAHAAQCLLRKTYPGQVDYWIEWTMRGVEFRENRDKDSELDPFTYDAISPFARAA